MSPNRGGGSHSGGSFGGGRSGGFRSSRSGGYGGPHSHHHGRPYGYGGRPYRRNYYGRSYSRGNPLCGLCCCVFFVLIFAGSFLIAFIDNAGVINRNFEMNAQETRLFELGPDVEEIEVSTMGGSIQTYFMNQKPALTAVNDKSESGDDYLQRSYYVSYNFYMYEGSSIRTTWNTSDSGSVMFYIIQGESEYEDYQDEDYFTSEYETKSDEGTRSFTADETDVYYFIFENQGSGKRVFWTFDYDLRYHDVSGAIPGATEQNSFQLYQPPQNYRYMVVKNVAPTASARVEVTISSEVNQGEMIPIVLLLVLLMVGGIGIGAKIYKKNKAAGPKTGPQGMVSNPAQYGQPQGGSSQAAPPGTTTTIDSSDQTFMQSNSTQETRMGSPSNIGKYSTHKPYGGPSSTPSAFGSPLPDPNDEKTTKQDSEISTISNRFCGSCGTALDSEMLKLLKKDGHVFCKFCGARID